LAGDLKRPVLSGVESGPSPGPVRVASIDGTTGSDGEVIPVFWLARGQRAGGQGEEHDKDRDEAPPVRVSLTPTGAGRRCEIFVVQGGLDEGRRCNRKARLGISLNQLTLNDLTRIVTPLLPENVSG